MAKKTLTTTAPRVVSHEIEMIPLKRIHPNPLNPRKDLGDVSELAASITAQGIRQNLLVVPHPDHAGEYMLVIGHRRHAAAKKAGLTEVPCAVDELTTSEQLVLMGVENVQRAQLTISEEADWMQGLLDLGELTKSALPKVTGLSRRVVDSRLTVAALPEAAKKSLDRGAITLDEVARIEKARGDLTEKEYEEALRLLGEKNSRWEIDTMIRRAKERSVRLAAAASFREQGFEVFESNEAFGDARDLYGFVSTTEYGVPREGDVLVLVDYSKYLQIYRPKAAGSTPEDAEAVAAREARERARAARLAEIDDATEQRQLFLLPRTCGKVTPAEPKADLARVREGFARGVFGRNSGYRLDAKDVAAWLLPAPPEDPVEALVDALSKAGEYRWMLACLASVSEGGSPTSLKRYATPSMWVDPDRTWGDCVNQWEYRTWYDLIRWYEFLEALGYEPTPYEVEQLASLRTALARLAAADESDDEDADGGEGE